MAELELNELTKKIIGCAYEVSNTFPNPLLTFLPALEEIVTNKVYQQYPRLSPFISGK